MVSQDFSRGLKRFWDKPPELRVLRPCGVGERSWNCGTSSVALSLLKSARLKAPNIEVLGICFLLQSVSLQLISSASMRNCAFDLIPTPCLEEKQHAARQIHARGFGALLVGGFVEARTSQKLCCTSCTLYKTFMWMYIAKLQRAAPALFDLTFSTGAVRVCLD